MHKKQFIALADAIRDHNDAGYSIERAAFNPSHLLTLADFCQSQNPQFNRERWFDYIAGKCGPNGGEVK